MAKNIDFMGAVFPDVPSIRLPQQGGGLVSFDDTTDADATADDIAFSKTAYVNGVKLVGTASGGSAVVEPLSVTQNGTYTAPSGVDGYSPITVNVSGGGGFGLEYEEGIWTPEEAVARGTISFQKTHTKVPVLIVMSDITGTYSDMVNTSYGFIFFPYYELFGTPISYATNDVGYGVAEYLYRSNSTSITGGRMHIKFGADNPDSSGTEYFRYWATESEFYPYAGNMQRLWRPDRNYKWIAIWKSTN